MVRNPTTGAYEWKEDGSDFRYGFNGKENDNEVKGEGNQQDYGMRIYDPRLAKFLSVDPISDDYPMLSPYQFASLDPIKYIDLDGLEGADIKYESVHSNMFIGGQGMSSEDKRVYDEAYNRIITPMAMGIIGEGLVGTALGWTIGKVVSKFSSRTPKVPIKTTETIVKKEGEALQTLVKAEKVASKQVNPYLGKPKEKLELAKESFERLIREHKEKLNKMRKDPIGNTKPEKLEQMSKDKPTEEVLMKRIRNQEKEVLDQIKKQEGELQKVNEALNKAN